MGKNQDKEKRSVKKMVASSCLSLAYLLEESSRISVFNSWDNLGAPCSFRYLFQEKHFLAPWSFSTHCYCLQHVREHLGEPQGSQFTGGGSLWSQGLRLLWGTMCGSHQIAMASSGVLAYAGNLDACYGDLLPPVLKSYSCWLIKSSLMLANYLELACSFR